MQMRYLVNCFWIFAVVSLICVEGLSQDLKPLPQLPKDTLPETIEIDKLPGSLTLPRTIPADNPLTHEKVLLGRRLFFDPILSKDRTVSCASCHQPNHGFAAPDRVAIGIGGELGERNAPSILNRAFGTAFFWDGRVSSLEEQALKPIENENELGNTLASVVAALNADPSYVKLFQNAFGSKASETEWEHVSAEDIGKALASFQRTLLIGDSPVDRFQAGEYGSLNSKQRQGLWIFESRGACWKCHSGDNYSDEHFHNTGIGYDTVRERDLGRFRVTSNEKDKGRFKTPGLRGVAQTAPYMHDGSLATLKDVVDFYNLGGNPNDPNLDHRIKPLGLTNEEVDAVVAFLEAISRSAKTERDAASSD